MSPEKSSMRLFTEVRGRGYPILCLHGHPGNGRCMGVFTTMLSQQFQTITPDLRGYGKSQTSGRFVMSDHLSDLAELLQRLNAHECVVLGWSLGGILAMELALQYPQQVSGLILLGTAARPRGDHPPISWQDNLLTGVASLINWMQPGQPWHINLLGRQSLYRHLLQRHTPKAYQHLADEGLWAFVQTSKSAQSALNQALQQGYNRLPAVKQITAPSLVLCGDRDRHITAIASQETARQLPNSTCKTYAQTAHLFPWEIPNEVQSDISAWLEQHFATKKSTP